MYLYSKGILVAEEDQATDMVHTYTIRGMYWMV